MPRQRGTSTAAQAQHTSTAHMQSSTAHMHSTHAQHTCTAHMQSPQAQPKSTAHKHSTQAQPRPHESESHGSRPPRRRCPGWLISHSCRAHYNRQHRHQRRLARHIAAKHAHVAPRFNKRRSIPGAATIAVTVTAAALGRNALTAVRNHHHQVRCAPARQLQQRQPSQKRHAATSPVQP